MIIDNHVDVLVLQNNSAAIVQSFYDMHIGPKTHTLDLTYGNGTFWKWQSDNFPSTLIDSWHSSGCDIYVGSFVCTCGPDFRATPMTTKMFDVVVFDPPYSAGGGDYLERYGAFRGGDRAPQNIHDVRALLAGGLVEAMRLSKKWVLLKTMDVVESGRLHNSTGLARTLFSEFEYRVIDYRLFMPPRREQPDLERGAQVRHFRNRPSVFMLAKRISGRG